MNPIRILLVDDHALFRRGVASLLEAEHDFEVVGQAENGLRALEMARELMPDLILMDISMPGMDGLEATRRIKAEIPYVRIVVLTVSDGDRNLFDAVKSGAQGYLLKNIEPQALYGTLRGVVRGEAPVSRLMAARLLDEFARQSRQPAPASPSPAELTAREKEVLEHGGPGPKQQGDRYRARDRREHRQEPPEEHPREASNTSWPWPPCLDSDYVLLKSKEEEPP